MPAGSGPQVARATAVSVAAAEVALVSMPAGNWQEFLGMLMSASVNFLAGTSQTSATLRVRQGSGTGGALVGIAHTVTVVAASTYELAVQELDTSAFALAQQGGVYTLTGQSNAAGPGTANAALFEQETIAPIT